jgi:hypothetical protein
VRTTRLEFEIEISMYPTDWEATLKAVQARLEEFRTPENAGSTLRISLDARRTAAAVLAEGVRTYAGGS